MSCLNGNNQQPVGSQKSRHSKEQGFAGKDNKMTAIQEMRGKGFYCLYCKISFGSDEDLKSHCGTESHQLAITTDDDKKWRFRPPPRGQKRKQLNLCHELKSKGSCRLGDQCLGAHSDAELTEWQERMAYREWKLEQARQEDLNGSSYAEQLLERWVKAPNPDFIMCDTVEGVSLQVDPKLFATFSAKNSTQSWTFTVKSKFPIRLVSLLYDGHRRYFRLVSLTNDDKLIKLDQGSQEWFNPQFAAASQAIQHQPNDRQFAYSIKLKFDTDIFGTFRQTLVLDFGRDPVLEQKLCVDVVPPADLAHLQEVRETVLCITERWNSSNTLCIPFENKTQTFTEQDLRLMQCYPIPNPNNFVVTQAIASALPSELTYKSRFHELLYIEEMAQYNLIARFNVSSKLQLVESYILAPGTTSIMKYAQKGELYACMKLSSEVSEDLPAGRMIQTNCSSVFLAPIVPVSKRPVELQGKRKVFEAIIEDKGKKMIYLRLPKQCVAEFNLKADREYVAEVQFQLNRMPFCEMHYSVDELNPVGLVFPNVDRHIEIPPVDPENPPWDLSLDKHLNPKQKEAITAITAPLALRLPPILIIGPFGTGKTFTLAQAVKAILKEPENRILVCTHSNSAADIYIREYLHPFVENGHPEAKPLRVYYQHRWVATVNQTVLQYCLISDKESAVSFRHPTAEDLEQHKVVVTTLSSSRFLVNLNLPKGFFTHILIDEAAQAMESEAILPLALADVTTRIALAGDHMQLSPEVYSPFAQEKNLQLSLLERLFDLYKTDYACKILLCENYRSHEAIVNYTSDMFYQNSLLASKSQPVHQTFYPLTFFTARGEDVQDTNSTAYYNNSEVYEVAERVLEIHKSWPAEWGPVNDASIGVVTPYYDQVVRIRTELRKRKLPHVSVERVLNVQGKQFRAIVLSTVRTLQTCNGGKAANGEELDYGFLSNARLLNTAITRGQSLVAVVGDPVSLCSMGKCRKLWEKFIRICYDNDSLHGISWQTLQTQLDGLELKKTYMLNPLAPEFIPRRMRHGKLLFQVPGSGGNNSGGFYGTPPPATPPYNNQPIIQPCYPGSINNAAPVAPGTQEGMAQMYPLGPFPDPYSLSYPYMGMPFPPPPHHFMPVPYNAPPYSYPWWMKNGGTNGNGNSNGTGGGVPAAINNSTGMPQHMGIQNGPSNNREVIRPPMNPAVRSESKLKNHEGFLNDSNLALINHRSSNVGGGGFQNQSDRGSLSTDDSGFDELERPFPMSRSFSDRFRLQKDRMIDPVEFAINTSQMNRIDRNRNMKNEVALTMEQQRHRFSVFESLQQQQQAQQQQQHQQTRRNSLEGIANNMNANNMAIQRPSQNMPDMEDHHVQQQQQNQFGGFNGIHQQQQQQQERFMNQQEDFHFQQQQHNIQQQQQQPPFQHRMFPIDSFPSKAHNNIELANMGGRHINPDYVGPFDRFQNRFGMATDPIDMSESAFQRRRSLPSNHAITVEQLEAMLLANGGIGNTTINEGLIPHGMILPGDNRPIRPMKMREDCGNFSNTNGVGNVVPEAYSSVVQRQFEDGGFNDRMSQLSIANNMKSNHPGSPLNNGASQQQIQQQIHQQQQQQAAMRTSPVGHQHHKETNLPISSSSQDLCSYEKLLQVSARVWSEPVGQNRPPAMAALTNHHQNHQQQQQQNMFSRALSENEIFERHHLVERPQIMPQQFGPFSIGPIGPGPNPNMAQQQHEMKAFRQNHHQGGMPQGHNIFGNAFLGNMGGGMQQGSNLPPQESRLMSHMMNGVHPQQQQAMGMQNGTMDKQDLVGGLNEEGIGGGYNVFQHKTILASSDNGENKAGLYHVF